MKSASFKNKTYKKKYFIKLNLKKFIGYIAFGETCLSITDCSSHNCASGICSGNMIIKIIKN